MTCRCVHIRDAFHVAQVMLHQSVKIRFVPSLERVATPTCDLLYRTVADKLPCRVIRAVYVPKLFVSNRDVPFGATHPKRERAHLPTRQLVRSWCLLKVRVGIVEAGVCQPVPDTHVCAFNEGEGGGKSPSRMIEGRAGRCEVSDACIAGNNAIISWAVHRTHNGRTNRHLSAVFAVRSTALRERSPPPSS